MRTIVLILIGLALAAVTTRSPPPPRRLTAAAIFAVGWLAVTGWNLATGLSHGYSLGEELPIQALILAIPVATAGLLAWTGRPT